jgi:hypothetical protein
MQALSRVDITEIDRIAVDDMNRKVQNKQAHCPGKRKMI